MTALTPEQRDAEPGVTWNLTADQARRYTAIINAAALATAAATYEEWVERIAAAEHEDCRLEWQAIAVVDPNRIVTQHGPDAHWGHAHDLIRRLSLAATPTEPEVKP